MGIFWKKPSVTATTPAPTPAAGGVAAADRATIVDRSGHADHNVVIAPYLTEKSSTLAASGQYTFLVARGAEKVGIARVIAARYRVHPIQVRIMRTSGKFVRYGTTVGFRRGVKKAIVTVQHGETIPFGVAT